MERLLYLTIVLIMVIGYWLISDRIQKKRKIKHAKLYAECMAEQEKNRQAIRKKFSEDRKKRERYMQECRQCSMWSGTCSDLVMKFNKELPDDVFADFYLQEGWTAYLPIEIGPLIKDTYLKYLMNSAMYTNPVITKTFPLI